MASPHYPIEKEDLKRLKDEFVTKMDNISFFVDCALSEGLFLQDHKNSIMDKQDKSHQIRQIHDIVEKELPSKPDLFVKCLLQSDNDYLVKILLPEGTNISDVRTHFKLDKNILSIKFEGKYQIKNFTKLRVDFVKSMSDMPTFIDHALVVNLLTLQHKNEILSLKNDDDKIRKMCDILEKKLPEKSDKFVHSLIESGNDHLVELLQPDEDTTLDCTNVRKDPDVTTRSHEDLVKELLPEGTNISDVPTHFNLDKNISSIKFEGKYQIKNFTKLREEFVKYMSDMPTFIDHALVVNLLTEEHKNQILSLKNADGQIRKMCDIMEKKLPEKSDKFVHSLIESGNDYLVELLQPDEGTTLDFTNVRKDPDVTTRSQDVDAESCYPMKNRGRVFIIENVNFFDGKYNRKGSEHDRKVLIRFFSKLNFKVIFRQNLTAEQMEKFLTKQIYSEKGSKKDCFILFILSHGRVEEIYGVDWKTMKYSVILEKFNDCPIWNSKPKLIYIQACQPFFPEEKNTEEEPDAQKVTSQIYPDGHFYIMYATILGEYDWRHPLTGTRLIQSLIKVYKENYLTEDIETMGIKVRREVYKIPESENKQIAVCHSCLSKRIFIHE